MTRLMSTELADGLAQVRASLDAAQAAIETLTAAIHAPAPTVAAVDHEEAHHDA